MPANEQQTGKPSDPHAPVVPASEHDRPDGPRAATGRAIRRLAAATRSPAGALQLAAAIAAAAALFTLAIPFLHSGLPSGHDLSAHLTYSYLFDRAAAAGQLPVRWTHGVRAGDGQPLFSFYQPGFYYAVQLVHVTVPSLFESMKVAMLVFWIAGATFMYRWWKHLGWMPAALAAVIFAGSPYLLLDVNVRASYPEFAAIACAVGALWAMTRLFERPSAERAALVACLLGVALICHLPATLIFSPVIAARAVASAVTSPERRAALLWCAAATVLGVGLAAFYVLPALSERHLIRMGALTADYFDYRNHFVEPAQWIRFAWGNGASVPGPADGMSFQVGVIQWMVVGVAAAICGWRALSAGLTRLDAELIFWLAVVAFALFMTSQASSTAWAAVPQLTYLQFPWRFLMLVAVACGCLAAVLLARVPGPRARAVIVLAVVIVQLAASRDQRRPDHYVPRRAMEIDRAGWARTRTAQAAAFVEPGYFPAGAIGRAPGSTLEPRPLWRATAPGSMVTPLAVADHRMELEVTSEHGTSLVLAWHMFPGWTFQIDRRESIAGRDPGTGFVRLDVPAGAHTVKAEFTNTPVRRAANGMSAASASSIVLLVAVSRLRRRRHRRGR